MTTQGAAAAPALPASDEAIRRRTGRGWSEWFDALDGWGAAGRPHREVARWVAGELGVDPLAWPAQAVTTGWERARGLRAVGEQAGGGFAVTVSKTVAVPVERLFDAFRDERLRARWLPDRRLRERTAARPRSARFDWNGTGSRVAVVFEAKGAGKSGAVLRHERLRDAAAAERAKAFWRGRLAALAEALEA